MVESKSCGLLIKQINDALERRANNNLRSVNLTMTQLGALLALDRAPGGRMTMKSMERELHVAQSTTAGIMHRMDEKGFLTSFGDDKDRRVKWVQITEEGKRVCAIAQENMKQEEAVMLSGMTPEDKDLFLSLLQSIFCKLN